MPRVARMVVEGVPYHVTQRGNRQQNVFFSDGDRRAYLSWLKDYCERYQLEILAYCLMTNHVHLVTLPRKKDSLALTLRSAHMRYSQMINNKLGWAGHLWQGKYFSTALDDAHLWFAVRYVELNPVRAGLVDRAEDYEWSSAAFHLGLRQDKILRSKTQWGSPMEEWDKSLTGSLDEDTANTLRSRTRSGFPCGNEEFVQSISEKLGRPLILRSRGRPRKG